MARGWKIWIEEVEGLYYPGSENKGADQLRGYRETDLRLCFRICKNRFSHKEANICTGPVNIIGSNTKSNSVYEHPLTPHFYIVKLGFTGVYIFFLFLLQNIDCGYSIEPSQ